MMLFREPDEIICAHCCFYTPLDCIVETCDGSLCLDCHEAWETARELEAHCECRGTCTDCTPGA